MPCSKEWFRSATAPATTRECPIVAPLQLAERASLTEHSLSVLTTTTS